MGNIQADSLKGIYQVWHNEETRRMVENGPFTPFHNQTLTPFFENEVIYSLCEQGRHMESEWFGVLSPVFFSKAGHVRPPFMREKMSSDIDVLSFTKSQNRNIILQGHRYHARNKGNFKGLVQRVLDSAGIEWDVERPLNFPVLMNYIVARSDVYDRYFREMLKPCMDTMRVATGDFRKLLWQDAEYHKSRQQRMRAHLEASIGVSHYPMHTFICERLWSVFLEMNPDIKRARY